ncbi:MAG: hypothetical protein KGD64_14475, partial [Candidatus Heimdallarchaeota archaeon]|nr:hypothetical protein [Candidatus Heimdallarchaeota archaeon]
MRGKISLALIFYLVISFSIVTVKSEERIEPFFNLVLRTTGGGVQPDYGLYIAQYLREIGIEVEVKVDSCPGIIIAFDPNIFDAFDLTISGFSDLRTQDMRDYYTEEGQLNLFSLNKRIPFQNESEIMQNEAVTTYDLEDRQQIYFDWQILFMDQILPLLPLFSSRQYMVTWTNTLGYDSRAGLVNSLPYMEYDGLHEGQVTTDEFILAEANWRNLNLLETDDKPSSFIFSLMSEPIVGWSQDFTPLKTSLVSDWNQIDESHFTFTMRDNVYWNPSFNITERDAASIPLDVSTTPLMIGLKNGDFSNGSNMKVTAKDAVFTYLAMSNPIISENSYYYNWISEAYVDPEDDLTFHLQIDGNPLTPELEPYVDFWGNLNQYILPEFFLNSTDPTVSYTSSGAKCTGLYEGIADTDPWVAYSTSAFGCGKYLLDYYVRNSITVLQANPYWMGIGAIDGTPQDLDIDTINIRVIPDILAELAEFKAGKLDLSDLTHFPEERKNMQADSRYEVQCHNAFGFSFLAFNLEKPHIGGSDNQVWVNGSEFGNYTKACAVRKAICYAIDRDEMNQVIHHGEFLISHRPM